MFSGSGAASEREAAYTASVIRSLVDGGNYKYGDIAVIMRSAKENGIIYRRAFDALGIPYASDKKENFLAFPEIELALAILRSVDDPLDDISLASALRSPVFRFDAEDLYSVKRYYAYESLYACVRRAAASFTRGETVKKVYRAAKRLCEYPRRRGIFPYHALRKGERPTAETRKKCRDAVALLLSLRRSGAECSAGGMIRLMYQKTRLISLCAAEKDGEKRVSHLNTLYKFALDYEKTSFRGITEFLAYLEKAASGDDFGFDPEQDENELVKILTVHQSKGLEYPVCFVSATG